MPCAKNKKFWLIVISLLTSNVYSAVVYIALLQNKNDPKKFIIPVGDMHQLPQAIETIQKNVVDELLFMAKSIAHIEKLNMAFLFECSPSHIKNIINEIQGGQEETFKAQADLIKYIHYLSWKNLIPIAMQPQRCDLRDPIENIMVFLQNQIFHIMPNVTKYKNLKDLGITIDQLVDQDLLDQLNVSRGPLYEKIQNNADQIYILGQSVSISSYLNKLQEWDSSIKKIMPSLPQALKKYCDNFFKAKKQAEDIIKSYDLNQAINIARLAITMEHINGQIAAGVQFSKLQNPSSVATDIFMSVALLKSQEKNEIIILFAGTRHILHIMEIIKDDYNLLLEYDIASNLNTSTWQFETKNEQGFIEILKKIAQEIPSLKQLIGK